MSNLAIVLNAIVIVVGASALVFTTSFLAALIVSDLARARAELDRQEEQAASLRGRLTARLRRQTT